MYHYVDSRNEGAVSYITRIELFATPSTLSNKVGSNGNIVNKVNGSFNITYIGKQVNLPSNLYILDRWLCVAVTWDRATGLQSEYLIDPTDGTILLSQIDEAFTDAPDTALVYANTLTTSGYYRLYGNNNTTIATTSGEAPPQLMAEIGHWEKVLSQSEIVDLAQKGFFNLNHPDSLVLNWNFMKNWVSLGNPALVPDELGNGNDLTLASGDTGIVGNYIADAPVPVFILTFNEKEHDFVNLDLFSGTTGTSRVCAYPLGTPQPTEQDIFDGVGAIASVVIQPDGIGAVSGVMTGLDTGTTYQIYAVQKELDIDNTWSAVAAQELLTPAKYSEIITDVTGAPVGSQTGIQWAWFDEENPSTLSSPSVQGVAELTDATGLLEITLPTSITTPKGSKGTMVLRADWGGGVQTASHLVEVK
jgi:hypothetical protein